MSEQTTIKFEMNDDLLRSVILKQAGSIEKAISEGIQNEKDAGATIIKVKIGTDYISIIGNGTGMTKTVIMNNFRIFGNSSKKGDNTKIGIFGMGRGQMFAMGLTTIRTLNYKLIVDVSKSLDFQFEDNLEDVKGTEVNIQLFEDKKLMSYQIQRICTTLSRMFYFTDCKIYINDAPIINEDAKTKTIDGITFIDFPASSDSKLYCKGIFIKDLSSVLETTKILANNLTLNFARNDLIIDSNSKVLEDAIDKYNADYIRNFDKRSSFSNIEILIQLLKKGMITKADILKIKCIKAAEGDIYYNIAYLKEQFMICNIRCYSNSVRFERYNQLKNTINGAYIDINNEVTSFLKEEFNIHIVDPSIDQKIKDTIKKLDTVDKTVDPLELKSVKVKQVIHVLELWNTELAKSINCEPRKLIFVETNKFVAQTDGSSWIKISMSRLKFTKWHLTAGSLIMDLLHEYAHNNSSENGSHTIEFYEKYHEFTVKAAEKISTLLRFTCLSNDNLKKYL